eukprot:ctg_4353.g673
MLDFETARCMRSAGRAPASGYGAPRGSVTVGGLPMGHASHGVTEDGVRDGYVRCHSLAGAVEWVGRQGKRGGRAGESIASAARREGRGECRSGCSSVGCLARSCAGASVKLVAPPRYYPLGRRWMRKCFHRGAERYPRMPNHRCRSLWCTRFSAAACSGFGAGVGGNASEVAAVSRGIGKPPAYSGSSSALSPAPTEPRR